MLCDMRGDTNFEGSARVILLFIICSAVLDLGTKPVSFITQFLKLCGVKMKGFKSFNISKRELENFCHGLKGNLEE